MSVEDGGRESLSVVWDGRDSTCKNLSIYTRGNQQRAGSGRRVGEMEFCRSQRHIPPIGDVKETRPADPSPLHQPIQIAKVLQILDTNLKQFAIVRHDSQKFSNLAIQISELFQSSHVVAPFSPADWSVGVWVCRSHQR